MKHSIDFTPDEESVLRYYRMPRATRSASLVIFYSGVLVAAGFGIGRFLITRNQIWLFGALTLLGYTVAAVLWRLVKQCNLVASILMKYQEALRGKADESKQPNKAPEPTSTRARQATASSSVVLVAHRGR